MRMPALALLVLAVSAAAPPVLVGSLQGVLLATGGGSTPIAGAQIWVPGTRWGAVTDSSGRFRIGVGVSGTVTLAVRVCHNRVQWVRVPIPWPDSVPVQLYAAAPKGCTPPGRPAWVVDSSDTTTYRGTLYRGVGGVPFVTCEGKTLYVDLPPRSADQFQSTMGIGDSLLVVLRGRLDTDIASQAHTTLFVAELRETARPQASFCSPGAR
jgi:hypothetical protein